MARNGSGTVCSTPIFGVGMAPPAPAPSVFGYRCVFWGKFMPVFTVSHCLFFCAIRLSSKLKAIIKNTFFSGTQVFHGQIGFSSFNNCIGFETVFFSYICRNIRLAFNNNFSDYTLISLLFFFCSPAAIGRPIISVIVNSINGISRWFYSHILCKSVKIKPSFAYGNTPSTIIFPLTERWIITTVMHSFPRIVKRMLAFSRFRLHALIIA